MVWLIEAPAFGRLKLRGFAGAWVSSKVFLLRLSGFAGLGLYNGSFKSFRFG